jgi:aspartate 1-decarboxylase
LSIGVVPFLDAIANIANKSRIETFVSPARRHSGEAKVQPVETLVGSICRRGF